MIAALTAALLVTLSSVRAQQATLAVAAASDLQAPLPQLAEAFEKESGTKVSLTFGSSGNFFTQIRNGAPFDILMSADVDYPRQLERAGLAESDTLYQYAIGRIVLWTRKDTGIDLREGLSVLGSAKVKRIAIANPDHAPYGRAAVAAMQRANVYDRAKPKLVVGENISQAAQFAASGNAEVGILALSLALAPGLKNIGRLHRRFPRTSIRRSTRRRLSSPVRRRRRPPARSSRSSRSPRACRSCGRSVSRSPEALRREFTPG